MSTSYRYRVMGAVAAVAAAAVLALPAQLLNPATASAADGKSVVVLGDSFSANGNIGAALENVLPGAKADCSHSPTSWPTQLSQSIGLAGSPDFVDVSCRGASLVSGPGYTLSQQAKVADGQGAFGPRTKTVLIQSGLNDAWGDNQVRLRQTLLDCVLDLARGCGPEAAAEGRATDYRGIDGGLYAKDIKPVVDYVRYYAPNAKIVLVGYPEMNAPGASAWCINTALGTIVQNRAGSAIELWNRIDAAQRAAAQELGLGFFDAKAVTAGHGLCSPEPWLAGILDPRSDLTGTPVHPSPRGDAAVAAGLARTIAG